MLELNEGNFKKETAKGIVVVDFWAEWCGPCKMIAPVFESLSSELKEMKFGKINVDEETDIASQFSVQSIPTFIIFKNGKEIDRIIGSQPKSALKLKLESFIK